MRFCGEVIEDRCFYVSTKQAYDHPVFVLLVAAGRIAINTAHKKKPEFS